MATLATTSPNHHRAIDQSATPKIAPVIDSVPWFIWTLFAAVVSVVIGGYWDISWHMSIGRDSFWTPAHIAIQLCGVLAGITCGYLILWTTFTHSRLRETSVN